ncbi:putative signal transducing protein [Cesiribacter andamanensis]|uniref:DUF2007 domain-containing protein n=1 Tax=Cesiribacter andamanensis AMV16 TaxID=1279009 RepID=M7NA93_9BACT|nr:DUF2007 domain-containing protein [Cesiribacter andamanensis]EMR04177.1 hypothetical protein ADICEAN_00701 [Cesiribacter andamanensis AMV16]
MKGWAPVYKTDLLYRAEIVKAVLQDNDIAAVVVDKRDSNYQIGHYEVHVAADDVLKAIKLIQDDISFE